MKTMTRTWKARIVLWFILQEKPVWELAKLYVILVKRSNCGFRIGINLIAGMIDDDKLTIFIAYNESNKSRRMVARTSNRAKKIRSIVYDKLRSTAAPHDVDYMIQDISETTGILRIHIRDVIYSMNLESKVNSFDRSHGSFISLV